MGIGPIPPANVITPTPVLSAFSSPASALRASARARSERFAVGLAVGYTIALAVAVAALRLVGESWWLTTAALYLPRIGFALPLPFVALALLFASRRRLWLLLVPVALLLFPLMGLQVGRGVLVKSAQAAGSGFRVLSYNISSADHAHDVAETVLSARADLILLQEWDWKERSHLGQVPGYHSRFDGQFGVLSRFPISDVQIQPPVEIPGFGSRPAEFIGYRIETDRGPVTVFNVHPISPRDSLVKLGDPKVLTDLRHGKLSRVLARIPHPEIGNGIVALKRNALMRWRQAEAIALAASQVDGPVIIAGDTNLPSLSRIYAQTLAGFRDGFAEAGQGFGYTYPAGHPWMRIDRILASAPLTFQHFEVLSGPGSDHLAVAADLTGL